MTPPLKVLHLPENSLPWITGGKEVFVHNLASQLQERGVINLIAVHQSVDLPVPIGSNVHEGIPTRVLPPMPEFKSRYGLIARRFSDTPGFVALLEEFQPDLVHFHDQGSGSSLTHLEIVHAKGIKSVFTYHTPGSTCPQGALLRNGTTPCDGRMTATRCTVCRFSESGLPPWLSEIVGRIKIPGISPFHPHRLLRLLTVKNTSEWFQQTLHRTMELTDAIVVLAEWCHKVWSINGCPNDKLHLIRTGGAHEKRKFEPRPWLPHEPLRLVCTGRFFQYKGFHVLVEAIKRLPTDAPIEVLFAGPYLEQPYGQSILQAIGDDPRFLTPRLIPHASMLEELSKFHMAVIPSIWFETGPLSAFDALAAGLPILGSRLGGIEEIVREGENGYLFPYGDAAALSERIASFLANPAELQRLQAQLPHSLPSMKDHAEEVWRLYQILCERE